MSGGVASKSPNAGKAVIELKLVGHLTTEGLRRQLAAAEELLSKASGPQPLLIDCQQMSGYDDAARDHFVKWNRNMRSSVRRLAVVTDRTIWHLVVSGMALASGQSMKAFNSDAAARAWLLS